MGEIIFFFIRFQITWWPSLFPFGSFDELLIPIGPLFQLQYDFLKSIEESSNIYNFSNTVQCFHLNRAENGSCNDSSDDYL